MIYLHTVPVHAGSREAKLLTEMVRKREPIPVKTQNGIITLSLPHLVNPIENNSLWVSLAGQIENPEDAKVFDTYRGYGPAPVFAIDIDSDGIFLYLELTAIERLAGMPRQPGSIYKLLQETFQRTAEPEQLSNFRSIYYDGGESKMAVYDYVNCIADIFEHVSDSEILGLGLVNDVVTNALASFNDIDILKANVSNDFTNNAYLNMTATLTRYYSDPALETNVLANYRVIGRSNDYLRQKSRELNNSTEDAAASDGNDATLAVFSKDTSDISFSVELFNGKISLDLMLPNIHKGVSITVEPTLNPLPKLHRARFLNEQEAYTRFLKSSFESCKRSLQIGSACRFPRERQSSTGDMLFNALLSEILSKVYAESELNKAIVTSIRILPFADSDKVEIQMMCDDSIVTFVFS